MTNFEFKTIEGQRIQQVLGAIGALPAAMLVFGDEPIKAASGAPLFILAIALGVAAIMAVNYTDSCFWLDQTWFNLPEDLIQDWESIRHNTEQYGLKVKNFSLIYGIASLIISAIGISSIYSAELRLPVPLWLGFLNSLFLIVLICVHVVVMSNGLQALIERYRAISEYHRD